MTGSRPDRVRPVAPPSAMQKLWRGSVNLLPPRLAVIVTFLHHHRKFPLIDHPKSFNDWVQHRKLYDRDPRLSELADKIRAKDYVARAVGAEYVIPSIWSGESLPPREERRWPYPYVLKASHASGLNLFIRSRNDEDWERLEPIVGRWLRIRHGSFAAEWLYAQIQPGILVEPYMGSGNELPMDYKLFVFGGRVEFIEVDTDRATNHRRCFYSRQWKRQPFGLAYPLETRDIPAPANLATLIALAERLGAGFDFVRVDLYEIRGRPLFGEMTFYPDSGLGVFAPKDWDEKLGRLWAAAAEGRTRERRGSVRQGEQESAAR